eukprot:Skav203809  [mRNA]  locus=scaffold1236:289215:294949:+ [translate_table: standard]
MLSCLRTMTISWCHGLMQVTAWAEIFDGDENIWVAVDVAYGDIIRYPAVEWPHRGTPMVWICAAGEQGYVDVTPRCPDAAGGAWAELLASCSSGCCESLATEAEAHDKASAIYCLAPKRYTEMLHPDAKAVTTVDGEQVYLRRDVQTLRTVRGWILKGRRVIDGDTGSQRATDATHR